MHDPAHADDERVQNAIAGDAESLEALLHDAAPGLRAALAIEPRWQRSVRRGGVSCAAMLLARWSWSALVLGAVPGPALAQQQFFVATSLPNLFARVVVDGDYDADGAPDMLVLTIFSLPKLLHNDGLGSFTDVTASLPAMTMAPQCATFVDFDGDGDRDLYVGTFGTQHLFEYRGNGVWADRSGNLPAALPGPISVVARDFDGDGDVDIALASHPLFSGYNGMLVNQGNGTFAQAWPFTGTGSHVIAADLDGDGDDDVVVGQAFSAGLALWRNNGGMQFTNVSANAPALTLLRSVPAAGDVDGDGDVDLVVVDGNQSGGVLLRNIGNTTFAIVPGALPPVSDGTESPALADVDGDGDLDLLRAGSYGPRLALNDGTGMFTDASSRLPPPTSPDIAWVVAGDLDQDGDVDVFASVPTVGTRVLRNHHRHLAAAAPPARGQSWLVDLWSQPGYATTARAAWLALGLARFASPVPTAPFGQLWLDPSAPFVVLPATIAANAPTTTFALPIPAVPAIAGVVLHVQGLVEDLPGFANARLTAPLSAAIQ